MHTLNLLLFHPVTHVEKGSKKAFIRATFPNVRTCFEGAAQFRHSFILMDEKKHLPKQAIDIAAAFGGYVKLFRVKPINRGKTNERKKCLDFMFSIIIQGAEGGGLGAYNSNSVSSLTQAC